jgi:putative oxidoreductase
MRILSIVLRVLVGLVFLAQGLMKLTGVQNEWRDELQVAPWFWLLTGVVQLAGALGLFASLRSERLAIPSGAIFVAVMLGAIATHIRMGDPISHMISPAVLLILAGAITVIAWQRTDVGLTGGEQRQEVDPV